MNPSKFTRKNKTHLIEFDRIGEYKLQVHSAEGFPKNKGQLFHCAIRNREELLTERIELMNGEILARRPMGKHPIPLLKVDSQGLWAFMEKQEVWWPLRRQSARLSLDRTGLVRLKFIDP